MWTRKSLNQVPVGNFFAFDGHKFLKIGYSNPHTSKVFSFQMKMVCTIESDEQVDDLGENPDRMS